MFFSPTSARSLPVRSLFASIYFFLILGGITMVVPFLIMLTGSVEPRSQNDKIDFFPPYLLSEDALWSRYVEIKYHGFTNYLRMAWNDPEASFLSLPQLAKVESRPKDIALWEEFLEAEKLPEELFAMGFMRQNRRMPDFTSFAFRDWLGEKYGTIAGINRTLDTSFPSMSRIAAPGVRIDGEILPNTPMVNAFLEFSAAQPPSRKFAWNIGGYYRTTILPRLVDSKISAYNQRFGTTYAEYAEVPFPATVPEIGAEPWFFFVSRILRTDFVQFTPAGQTHQAASRLGKSEFIRTTAQPGDLIVVSADTLFHQWAVERGVSDARIPQESLDRADFAQEKTFWRNQFLTLNYRMVLGELLDKGGAIRNTFILVILSVAGALIINPLAAYALSRYKMKSSYHILLFCLATIAFPAEVTMIPVFLQLKEFHLLNTFGALVLPGLANGFSIFLLKGFFDSLPRELYEAADIDGASELTTFWTITMNLSKPILAVIALQAFVTAYGTFFFALILAPDPKMWTIMVYIYQLRAQVGPPVVYASLIITALPTLIVFVTCQNIILRGIVVPSDK